MLGKKYPMRCEEDGGLIRRASSANHLGWVPGQYSPLNPPTGTPRNGRRASRLPAPNTNILPVNNNNQQQLQTPPASQQTGNTSPVNGAGVRSSREDSAFTPTPTETPVPAQKDPTSSKLASPPPTRPQLRVDIDDEPFQITTLSPTPAPPTSASRTKAAAPASPTAEMENPFQRPRPSNTSRIRAASVLVPETPLNNLADHHHGALRTYHNDGNGSVGPPPTTRTRSNSVMTDDLPEQTQVERLRTQQSHFADSLNESTAIVNRLRTRNQIAELDIVRERAFVATATQARDAAIAGREQAIAAARLDAEILAEKRGRTATTATTMLALTVFVGLLYGFWCWFNAPDARYIREKAEAFYWS